MSTKTPTDLTIGLRDYRFGRDTATQPRWWLGGDLIATAFFNALSATFPLGERFFMESVKAHRGAANGALKEQIAAFLYQEAMHSREHVAFNEMAERSGYDMAPLEARTRRLLALARSRPQIEQLAGTCALEHFTAILANALLNDARLLDGAPSEAQELWRWHAMEEIEHKAVAFDTFMAATADWSPLRRWVLRSRAMSKATLLFFVSIGGNLGDLFRQDGANVASTWLRMAGYLWIAPGIARQVLGAYFTYYRPGFHPWDHDDRDLLLRAQRLISRQPETAQPMGVPA
jgi:predicted metal-dependent hydrolase